MLTFDELTYFMTTAQLGSLTAAARELYVSQQALSASIKRLEGTLGFPLFHRLPHGMVLTEQGRSFHAKAAEVMSSVDELYALCLPAASEELRILYMPQVTFHEFILHNTKQEFEKRFPRISISLEPSVNLKNVNFDEFAFVCYHPYVASRYSVHYSRLLRNFESKVFADDSFCLILNKSNEAYVSNGNDDCGNGDDTECIELNNIVMMDRSASNSAIIDKLLQEIRRQGYRYDGSVETRGFLDDIFTLVELNPSYAGIVPQIMLSAYQDQLSRLHIIDLQCPTPSMHYIACNKLKLKHSEAAKEFLAMFLNESNSYHRSV